MTLVQSLDESGLLQLNSEELEELFNHRIQVDKILDVLINIIHNFRTCWYRGKRFQRANFTSIKKKKSGTKSTAAN